MPCSMRGKFFKIWLILQFLVSLLLVGLSTAVVAHDSHHWNLISVIAYSIWAALTLLDTLAHTLLKLHYRKSSNQFIVGCSFFRLLYTIVCLSIALMCDIFQLAVAFPDIHDGSGRVILARALMNFVSFISFTYGVVIVLVILTTRVTSKLSEKDSSPTTQFATNFFISFLIHFVGQAIVQLFMLLTVTRRLHNDYPDIDGYLWTIVVLAIVIPIAGTLMYFVLNVFWIKQFLTGIFTTLLSIDVDSIASLDLDVTQQQRIEQIRNSLNISFLRQEAARLKDQRLRYKILFTFQNPLAIFLSSSYTVLLLLFLVFQSTAFFHTLGWKVFFYISVGLYALLNIHALAVSFYWLVVLLITVLLYLCGAYISTKLPGCHGITIRAIECLCTCTYNETETQYR